MPLHDAGDAYDAPAGSSHTGVPDLQKPIGMLDAAIASETATKGTDSWFQKTDRGQFARKASA
jgi:hypothetical protein